MKNITLGFPPMLYISPHARISGDNSMSPPTKLFDTITVYRYGVDAQKF